MMSWLFKRVPRQISKAACLVITCGFLCVSSSGLLALTWDDPATWTLDQWVAWRDKQIFRILDPTVKTDGKPILSREEVILRSVDAYKVLIPMLANPDFLAKRKYNEALGNFSRFVRTQSQMAIYDKSGRYTHALGYFKTDQEYWQQGAPFLTFPVLLRSKEFLKALSSPSTYRTALDLIDRHNLSLAANKRWMTLVFRSGFLKSADTETYGRLLVFIPGETNSRGDLLEKWVQFSLAVPNSQPPSHGQAGELRSVSMVSVCLHPGVSPSSTAYLADFMRTVDRASGEFRIVPTMLGSKNPSKNCFDCHKSPVLPIHPKATYRVSATGDFEGTDTGVEDVIEQLNRRISGYGNCEFACMDTESYGPSIGSANVDWPDSWMKSISGNPALSQESLTRVRQSMKCGSCHTGSQSLNYPQATETNIGLLIFEQKKGLVQTYIENGWMPPKNTLTTVERDALWRCLAAEYLDTKTFTGSLIDWLKGSPRSQAAASGLPR